MLKSRYKPWMFIAALAALFAAMLVTSWNYSKPTASAQIPAAVSQRPVQADVKPFNLSELVEAADRVYRGTVLSTTPGVVQVGGGELPFVTYRFQVEEAFVGDFETVKDIQIAEMRMLGKMAPLRVGELQRQVALPQMPRMEIGETYLIFATKPSTESGLSASVGLGQGTFQIAQGGKDELAVNEYDNRGLFRDMDTQAVTPDSSITPSGAVRYSELARQIRTEMTKRGRSK